MPGQVPKRLAYSRIPSAVEKYDFPVRRCACPDDAATRRICRLALEQAVRGTNPYVVRFDSPDVDRGIFSGPDPLVITPARPVGLHPWPKEPESIPVG